MQTKNTWCSGSFMIDDAIDEVRMTGGGLKQSSTTQEPLMISLCHTILWFWGQEEQKRPYLLMAGVHHYKEMQCSCYCPY
jgi:hypothetical protein